MSDEFYDEATDLTQLPKPSKGAKATKMPAELSAKVNNFTPFQRKYMELRARGLKQAEAAKRAGSTSEDRGALGRIGYGIEQQDGAKEYISWLQEQRAKVALVDATEVVDMIRTAYKEAMFNNKYTDAIKAAELLGKTINLFEEGSKSAKKQTEDKASTKEEQDNQKKLEAFKEEDRDTEPTETDKKVAQLQDLIKQLNKGK